MENQVVVSAKASAQQVSFAQVLEQMSKQTKENRAQYSSSKTLGMITFTGASQPYKGKSSGGQMFRVQDQVCHFMDSNTGEEGKAKIDIVVWAKGIASPLSGTHQAVVLINEEEDNAQPYAVYLMTE